MQYMFHAFCIPYICFVLMHNTLCVRLRVSVVESKLFILPIYVFHLLYVLVQNNLDLVFLTYGTEFVLFLAVLENSVMPIG